MRGSIDDLSAIRQEAVEQTLALDALEALHVRTHVQARTAARANGL
jgi:hypothetical protein